MALRSIGVVAALLLASCVHKPQQVNADHLMAQTGAVSLENIHGLRFETKDGFIVSASGGYGELTVSETTICGPLSVYIPAPDTARPAWVPPTAKAGYLRFEPVSCIDRGNIARTTMTVQRADAVASATCLALLPLCALAFSAPGQ